MKGVIMENKVKEKECEACGIWFTPSRSNVKYCPNCRTHSDQIVRQMERNTQRNIDRYGYGQKTKKIQNVCKECGKIFISYLQPKNYCSKQCGEKYRIKHTTCAYCGKLMTKTEDIRDMMGKPWFCSHECEENKKWEIAIQDGKVNTCPNCGKEFIKKGTYCSQGCYQEFMRKKKAETERRKAAGLKLCPVCWKEFSGNEICCSSECLQKKKEAEPHAMRKCSTCGKVFSCPVSDMASVEYSFCSLECEKKFSDIIARKEKLKKEKQKKQAEEKLQKYIQKNGLCSICKTSYVDCERMQSGFRCYPKGSSCKGNLVIKCPKFTR